MINWSGFCRTPAAAAGVERQLLPDRTVDDADDPDLGAATMEDAIMGEGDEA